MGLDESEARLTDEEWDCFLDSVRTLPSVVIQGRKLCRPKFVPTLQPIAEELDSAEDEDSLMVTLKMPLVHPMAKKIKAKLAT